MRLDTVLHICLEQWNRDLDAGDPFATKIRSLDHAGSDFSAALYFAVFT